jgi:hypothetical protein
MTIMLNSKSCMAFLGFVVAFAYSSVRAFCSLAEITPSTWMYVASGAAITLASLFFAVFFKMLASLDRGIE